MICKWRFVAGKIHGIDRWEFNGFETCSNKHADKDMNGYDVVDVHGYSSGYIIYRNIYIYTGRILYKWRSSEKILSRNGG